MTLRDFYVDRMKQERPAFSKVAQAIPAGALDYKPHARSPSAGQLLWTLAAEAAAAVDLIDKGRTEWNSSPHPPRDEMIDRVRTVADLFRLVVPETGMAWAGAPVVDGRASPEPASERQPDVGQSPAHPLAGEHEHDRIAVGVVHGGGEAR